MNRRLVEIMVIEIVLLLFAVTPSLVVRARAGWAPEPRASICVAGDDPCAPGSRTTSAIPRQESLRKDRTVTKP